MNILALALRAWIAQLVEQRIENPRVAGSIPAPGTTIFLKVNRLEDSLRLGTFVKFTIIRFFSGCLVTHVRRIFAVP